MSFAKKLFDPIGVITNPTRSISKQLIGKQIERLGFTRKKADLTGLELLKSRGVNLDTINDGTAAAQPLDGTPPRRRGYGRMFRNIPGGL